MDEILSKTSISFKRMMRMKCFYVMPKAKHASNKINRTVL